MGAVDSRLHKLGIILPETFADHLVLEDSKIPAVGTLGKNESGLLTGHDRI